MADRKSSDEIKQIASMLVQLSQSPVVFSKQLYQYNGANYFYATPYIVVSTDITYPQKVNDKEVSMEITIRPANEKIIQTLCDRSCRTFLIYLEF